MNRMSCIHIQSTAISVKNTKVAILFSVFSWMKLLYTQADTEKLIKLYSAQKMKWSSIVLSPIVWFNIVNTTHQTSIRCHVDFTNWFLNLSFSFHSFLFFEVKTLIEMSSFITCSGYYCWYCVSKVGIEPQELAILLFYIITKRYRDYTDMPIYFTL